MCKFLLFVNLTKSMDGLIKCCDDNCKDRFNCCDSYRVHMNVIHMNAIKIFKCTKGECRSTFLSSKGLFDHLSRTHKYPKKVQSEINNIASDKIYEKQIVMNNVTQSQSTLELSENYESDRDINSTPVQDCMPQEGQLHEILLSFLMDLHANSHMTKEDINKIFNKIKIDIVDPITSMINLDQKEQNLIDTAFEKLNSQYKFEQTLKKKGYFINGKFLTAIVLNNIL